MVTDYNKKCYFFINLVFSTLNCLLSFILTDKLSSDCILKCI